MAFKTIQQLTDLGSVADNDLLPAARSTGAMISVKASYFKTYLATTFLQPANNLSDLANAATARTNLGLGTAATHASTDFLASTGGTLSGALTVSSGGVTITAGGFTYAGGTVAGVNAVSALSIDWAADDIHTKSISANSTFTFTGFTASKSQVIMLDLTISSAAIPTWPASVKWANGSNPSSTLGNGRHLLGFFTDDGGTTVIGNVVAKAVA